MAIEVKILADSLSPCGKRLTTRLWKYPRSIHSEIMTHKMLSKNSASSRAIPTEKLIQMILDDPFVPEYIGANQKGMQAGEELSEEQKQLARSVWDTAMNNAVISARTLMNMGVHKQVVNRIIEPWMWITIIVSATENENLWGLRCHPMAEPHFQKLAYMDRDAVTASVPKQLQDGEWHLPLVDVDGDDTDALDSVCGRFEIDNFSRTEDPSGVRRKVSVGRCARVSFLTHEGKREIEKDIELHDRLVVQTPLHASPAEHVAQAMDYPRWYKEQAPSTEPLPPLGALQERVLRRRENSRGYELLKHELIEEAVLAQMRSGNFIGFRQYRKTLPNEHIGGLLP